MGAQNKDVLYIHRPQKGVRLGALSSFVGGTYEAWHTCTSTDHHPNSVLS